MNWEREMNEAIAAQGPAVDIAPEVTPLYKGSITFAPDQSKPCYCASCVTLQADNERLRQGNRRLLSQLSVARAWYQDHHPIAGNTRPIPPWEVE